MLKYSYISRLPAFAAENWVQMLVFLRFAITRNSQINGDDLKSGFLNQKIFYSFLESGSWELNTYSYVLRHHETFHQKNQFSSKFYTHCCNRTFQKQWKMLKVCKQTKRGNWDNLFVTSKIIFFKRKTLINLKQILDFSVFRKIFSYCFRSRWFIKF